MKTLTAALLLLLPAAAGDQVELLNGTRYDGRMLDEKPDRIRFEVVLPGGGGRAQIDIPTGNVHAITTSGKRRIVNEKAAPAPRAAPAARPEPKAEAPAGPAGPVRSKAEVKAIVQKVGATPPGWYASTRLNYPSTLDLSWPQPAPPGPWNPSLHVGHFIWSSINENESRWKEGVRFLHHLLGANKNDPDVVRRTMNALGVMYHNLHQDWARAAFWWEKCGIGDPVDLAHCYYKLGSKELAVEILSRIPSDQTRFCSVARLWSEMGEHDRALKMALAAARSTPDVGFLAAGDICRTVGRSEEALAYYQKVLDASSGGRDLKQAKGRAQASLDAIRLVDALDLRKVRDGTYSDSSIGYSGPVDVSVTVAGGRIADVRVTRHTEKQYYASITDTSRQILEKQGVKGVDATSGATITSEAILNATVKSISKGLSN